MLERGKLDRGVVEIVHTESLVPKEHLLRKIDAAVDFNQLHKMVDPLDCEDNGRPSVDPVVLFKMVLRSIYTACSLCWKWKSCSALVDFLHYMLITRLPLAA